MSRFERSVIDAIPLGMKAANDYNANERADAQLKMQQAEEARRAAEYERTSGINKQVDSLKQKLLGNPSAAQYAPTSTATQFAPDQTPLDINAPIPAVGGLGLADGAKLGGQGLSARTPIGQGDGMQPTQNLGLAPKQQYLKTEGAPERGNASRILSQIAVLTGDTDGYARHSQNARAMDFQDGFNSHIKDFLKATPEEREAMTAPLTSYVNANNTRVLIGKPDEKNFVQLGISDAAGNADFSTRLSLQDQARLYAAHHMMGVDATTAMAEMSAVNKTFADAIKQHNDLALSTTEKNNTGAHYSTTANHQAASLAAQIAHYNASEGLQRQSLENQKARDERERWRLGGVDDNGNAILYDQNTGDYKIGPKAHSMSRAGSGSGGTKIPSGDFISPDGTPYKYDTYGNKIHQTGGVETSLRTSALTKAGVPEAVAPTLQWNNYGTAVRYGDLSYDVNSPKDMALLTQTIRADQLHIRGGEEAALRGKGLLDPRDAAAATPDVRKAQPSRGLTPMAYPGLGNGVVETRRGPVAAPEGVEPPPHLRYLNGENPFDRGLQLPDALKKSLSANEAVRYNQAMGASR